MSGWSKITQKDAKSSVWVVADQEGNEIAEGEGLASLVEALKPEDISFAAILVHGVDAQENVKSVRPKIVRINWVCTAVKPMKKMGALAGKSTMAEKWQGSAADMDANESADVSMASIGK